MKRLIGLMSLVVLLTYGFSHCSPPENPGAEPTQSSDAGLISDKSVARTCFDDSDCVNAGRCINGQCSGGGPVPDRAPTDTSKPDTAASEPAKDTPTQPESVGPDQTPGPEPQGPEPQGPEPQGPEPSGPEPSGPEPSGPESNVRLLSVTPSQVSVCTKVTETLTLKGAGFQKGAKVKIGKVEYPSTYQDSQTLKVTVNLVDLDQGKQNVVVINPDQSISQPVLSLDVTVSGKQPKITKLQPSQVCGTNTVTIGVMGSGFAPGVSARFQTVPLPTTRKSCNEITFKLDLSTAPTGTYKVEVCNSGNACSLEADLKVLDSSQCP